LMNTVEEEEAFVNAVNPTDYRGLFGIKGRARDLLGLLGDAFLVQGGADPMYRQRRDRELQADALKGFDLEDPEMAQAALERLNRAGFPKEALDTRLKVGEADSKKAYQENTIATRNLQNEIRNADLKRRNYELYSKFSGGLVRGANPQTWPAIRARLLKMGSRLGVEDDIPEEFDQDWIDVFSQQGMTGYQAERAAQMGKDIDSKVSTRRPREPKNPPRPVVVQNPDGTFRYERPDKAVGQTAPPPRAPAKGSTASGPPVPKGFKKLPDGRLQNIATGEIFSARKKG
jgi:hypothetical protein